MGSVTGFNSVLTLYQNFIFAVKNRGKSTNSYRYDQANISKEERIMLLRQNLKMLGRNYQEIQANLEVKQQRYQYLKRTIGLDSYSQQNVNELSSEISNFKNYLLMISNNIVKTRTKINNLESSTSVFFDILNLNFTKFETSLKRIMVIYCSYRFASVYFIKLPFLIYNYLAFATSSSSSSINNNNDNSASSGFNKRNPTSNTPSSLSINLKNYLYKSYYQQNSTDELVLLNKIEIFISACFFFSCFTGVLNTFNNLILVFSKISNRRKLLQDFALQFNNGQRSFQERAKYSNVGDANGIDAPLLSLQNKIDDNPYGYNASPVAAAGNIDNDGVSVSPVPMFQVSNQSPKFSNGNGNIINDSLTPRRGYSNSISTGSVRMPNLQQQSVLTPTRSAAHAQAQVAAANINGTGTAELSPIKFTNNNNGNGNGNSITTHNYASPLRESSAAYGDSLRTTDSNVNISDLNLDNSNDTNSNTNSTNTNNNGVYSNNKGVQLLAEPFKFATSPPYSDVDIGVDTTGAVTANNMNGIFTVSAAAAAPTYSDTVTNSTFYPYANVNNNNTSFASSTVITGKLLLMQLQLWRSANMLITNLFQITHDDLEQMQLIANSEKLLISQLTAIYIISTSLMLRSTFSVNSINMINNLFNVYRFSPSYLDYLFEFWFVVVSAITGLGLILGKKFKHWDRGSWLGAELGILFESFDGFVSAGGGSSADSAGAGVNGNGVLTAGGKASEAADEETYIQNSGGLKYA